MTVVAGIALALVAASLPQPTNQLRDIDRVVVVARVDAQLPDVARSLGGARTVDSIAALDAALDADTRVIVIDRSLIAGAANGSLRDPYLRGITLMTIDASVGDLRRLSGQEDALRAIDPQLADDTAAHEACTGVCARYTSWSWTWRSCAGDQSGSGLGPFSPGHTSAREFDAFLTQKIRLGPPCPAN